ncbi:TlpA family protein disulfide reductase [Aestuariivivens insulae]|uniref:TlpA family protein disulfide reductase n=1 Tax=Aestuariivivens insulae TaxID=1621988 RepID=UPI001F5ABFD2|nr:hypothetical protein [Aestuariivivens insulae]
MKFYIGLLILAITCFGCKKDTRSSDRNYAYFGGQVINPKSNFVVLYKSENVLDTILLDGNNRFIHKIDNLKAGFYTFRHGDEIQSVLLEPQDSLLFRLNTLDFDESLVYTGLGAKKNNYFISEYLQNEPSLEVKNLYKSCQLDIKSFEEKIKNIRKRSYKVLEAFKEKNPTSNLFNNLAKANIDYNYYLKKEAYPLYHKGTSESETLALLPNDFYAYRELVNYNDSLLKDSFSYQSFLRYNLSNLSCKTHLDHSKKKHFNWASVCFTLDRLNLIDSLIDDTTIKNNLLYHYTSRFLANNKEGKNNEAIIEAYLEKSTDKEKSKMVKQYASAIKSLKPGNYLPNIVIKDYSNKEYQLDSKIQATTVICFWTLAAYNHFKDCHNRVKELEIKYPEVSFIRINIDDYNAETIQKTLRKNYIGLDNEYLFKNPEKARATLAIYPKIKTFIIDKNKKIVNSNSNIFNHNFEEELLGAINR